MVPLLMWTLELPCTVRSFSLQLINTLWTGFKKDFRGDLPPSKMSPSLVLVVNLFSNRLGEEGS